jgi:LysM domain
MGSTVTARPPLRLTRRGRIVAAAVAAALIAAVSAAAAGGAQATSHALPRMVTERHLSRVVVRPGQNLWSIAEAADPAADARAVTQQIVQLNSLTTYQLYPGEQLWVPRG